MPVDFETHEPGNPRVDLSEGTNARRLLEFLLTTPTVGYTPAALLKSSSSDIFFAGTDGYKEPYSSR